MTVKRSDLLADKPKLWPASLLPANLQGNHLKGIFSLASPALLVTAKDDSITTVKTLTRLLKQTGEKLGWHRHCFICKSPTVKISNKPMCCANCRIALRDVTAVSECATCKKEIRRRFCAYVFKKKNAKIASYCSKKCHGKSNTAKRAAKCKPCARCGKTTKTPLGKFCSRGCSDMSRRTRLGKLVKCALCGDTFEGVRNRRKTCSKECTSRLAAINMQEQNKEWLKNHVYVDPRARYPQSFRNTTRKELIRERDLYGCAICRKKPDNRKHLFIHHIDWVKTNSRIDNLICLCSSCHAKGHNRSSEFKFNNAKLIALAQSRTKRMPKTWKQKLAVIDLRYDDDGKLSVKPLAQPQTRQNEQSPQRQPR